MREMSVIFDAKCRRYGWRSDGWDWDKAYLHIKWHLDPSHRLGTIDIGGKLGAVPFWGRGEPGPHLTQCRLGRGLTSY